MIAVIVRALSTVLSVAIAVAAAAKWGDTAFGRLLAGVLIATAVALVEGILVLAPRRWVWAARLLDPDRTGVVRVTLDGSLDAGHGRVDHVAERRRFDFDVFRVTTRWLAASGLDGVVRRPDELRDPARKQSFALAYAKSLAEKP